jgi:hypothetical protein
MNFSTEDLKIIFNAVRYYQMNRVSLNGDAYKRCDNILNQIFPIEKDVTVSKVSTEDPNTTTHPV